MKKVEEAVKEAKAILVDVNYAHDIGHVLTLAKMILEEQKNRLKV